MPGPDLPLVALADEDGSVQVFRSSDGQAVAERATDEDGSPAVAMAPSSGCERLAVAWEGCAVSLVEVATGQPSWRTDEVETRGTTALGFTAEGEALVVASDADFRHDAVIQVLEARTGRVRRRTRIREPLSPLLVDGRRGEVLWRGRGALDGRLFLQTLRPGAAPRALPVAPIGGVVAISGDGSRVATAAGTTVVVARIRDP